MRYVVVITICAGFKPDFDVPLWRSTAMGSAPSPEAGEAESSNVPQLGPETLQIDMSGLSDCIDCKVWQIRHS